MKSTHAGATYDRMVARRGVSDLDGIVLFNRLSKCHTAHQQSPELCVVTSIILLYSNYVIEYSEKPNSIIIIIYTEHCVCPCACCHKPAANVA